MPTYGYACAAGHYTDLFLTISEYGRLGPESPCPLCGRTARRQFDEVQIIGDELKSAKVMGASGQLETHHGDRDEIALGVHLESKSHLRRVLKERGLVEVPDRSTARTRTPARRRPNPAVDLPKIAALVPHVREERLRRQQAGEAPVAPGFSDVAGALPVVEDTTEAAAGVGCT